MASLTFMSYADMLFATVPAAPPTRKNQRTTSCPAPISANVPYQRGSRLILSALEWLSFGSSFTALDNSNCTNFFGNETRQGFRRSSAFAILLRKAPAQREATVRPADRSYRLSPRDSLKC